MTYTREELEAEDKDTLITILLREREVAESVETAMRLNAKQYRAEIVALTQERNAALRHVRYLLHSATPNQRDHPTMWKAWRGAETFLVSMDKPAKEQP